MSGELAALRTPSEPLAAVPMLARRSWLSWPWQSSRQTPHPGHGVQMSPMPGYGALGQEYCVPSWMDPELGRWQYPP